MKAVVHISLKTDIRDPQGEAIADALRRLGHEVLDARCGKRIELEMPTGDAVTAEAQLRKMSDELLANPLTEHYRVELLPD